MTRKLFFRIILAIVVIGAIYRFFTSQPEYSLTHITGQTMGTIDYNVKYMGVSAPNYKASIDSLLVAFNQSLSTYIPDSEISQLNRTGHLDNPSRMFLDVLECSREVYENTGGAFDPTVGPLVSAWGFGANRQPDVPDSSEIDSLLRFVGFEKLTFSEKAVTMDSGMYLDFSAIAKGYAVDVVVLFLERKGFRNYMVEIGGEVRAKGENEKNEVWKIGIDHPLPVAADRELLAIAQLKDRSMATSGNYRNYYQVDGRTIAHTVDPRTGYNTSHTLLSASVFAPDCMTADAYATAFMVLGLNESEELIRELDLDAFLIYQDTSGKLASSVSEGLQAFISLDKTE